MSSPVGGGRQDGGGGRAALQLEIRMLRRTARSNAAKIARLESRAHWFAGFLSANILIGVVNLIRDLGGS